MGQQWFAIRTNIKCEAKAERSLENAGYEVYLPRKRIERQHHRTKAWLLWEFPLFMRYLFVSLPDIEADFYTLRRCDGVESVLGIPEVVPASVSENRVVMRPVPIPAKDIEALRLLQNDLAFDETRAAQIHRKEIGRTKKETTKMRFPKGTRFRTEVGGIPFVATVTNVNAKGAVEAMVSLFGRLSAMEVQASEVGKLEIVEEEAAA